MTEMTEMICYADLGDFLRGLGFRVKFSDYEEGLIVQNWYTIPILIRSREDLLRFIHQKYPVVFSSILNTNDLRIRFRREIEL